MEPEKPNSVERFIGGMAERLGAVVKATTIFGEPVEREGITVIPVGKARWGLVAALVEGRTGMERAVVVAHRSAQLVLLN